MILVFSTKITPRLHYTCEVIFRDVLKYQGTIRVTSELKEYIDTEAFIKICYDTNYYQEGIHIVPSDLIYQTKIISIFPGITDGLYSKAIFPTEGSKDFNYDVFSAIFYMVSRYEEYTQVEKDTHGRFKLEGTFSYQHDFYKKPYVHYWVEELKDKIMQHYPKFLFPSKVFRALATIDVDNGFAYQGKGSLRTAGAYAKDLLRFKFSKIIERTHVLTGNKKDPFNHYKFQKKLSNKSGVKLRYFVLSGNKSEYDNTLKTDSAAFKRLVKKLSICGKVGLHPSYASNDSKNELMSELNLLSTLLKKKVRHSRQHFLKVTLPSTYENLIELGITNDYSMGFSHTEGFRACIAEPFHFYNLAKEEATNLVITPFQVMDSAYRDIKKVNLEKSYESIIGVIDEVRKVNGLFCFVWHDRAFASWPEFDGWKNLYKKVIQNCAD